MALIKVSPSAMDRLFAHSERQGVPRTSRISRSADFSSGCQAPVTHEYYSHEDPIVWMYRRTPKNRLWRFKGGASHLNNHFEDNVPTPPRRYFTATLPCRKCPHCLRLRAQLWRHRAINEIRASSRTWFGTFTINPEHRFRIDVQTSINGDDQSSGAFVSRHDRISRLFTLYFKRVRKSSRANIRYMLVAEQHKDGWPHYHVLIHERGTPVTKRELQTQWPYGFTNFKLVSGDGAALYLTKYISKQALARIRASLKYGTALAIATEESVIVPTPKNQKRFLLDCAKLLDKGDLNHADDIPF